MSNGFVIYHQRSFIDTPVNHWIADRLQDKLGSFPISLSPGDLESIEDLARELHPASRPHLKPLLELLRQGRFIVIDRDI